MHLTQSLRRQKLRFLPTTPPLPRSPWTTGGGEGGQKRKLRKRGERRGSISREGKTPELPGIWLYHEQVAAPGRGGLGPRLRAPPPPPVTGAGVLHRHLPTGLGSPRQILPKTGLLRNGGGAGSVAKRDIKGACGWSSASPPFSRAFLPSDSILTTLHFTVTYCLLLQTLEVIITTARFTPHVDIGEGNQIKHYFLSSLGVLGGSVG